MKLVTLDFETFYSYEYSLTRMSTEDYVTDPRFEVILVAAKVNDGKVNWITGDHHKIQKWLDALDIPNSMLMAHNTMFDGLILQHHFGIIPKMYGDTMGMAQALIRPYSPRVSLKACLEHTNVGVAKGDTVVQMINRPRQSLNWGEMVDYASYCCDDVEGTFRLFKHLLPTLPGSELRNIDLILRMYMEPTLKLDASVLAEVLAETRAKKLMLLGAVEEKFPKHVLMSNEKFATALESIGVEVPKKVSPTTGKLTWALAKGDPEFKAMQEEYADDPFVQAALAARLGAKSTIEESRAERLLNIAKRYTKLRVPLRYYAAHTGRLGGMEKINMQNPPRIDKSQMRFGFRAPKNHVVLAADLSQIEARIVAWLARQYDLLEQFRQGRDVYSEFASIIFKRLISRADKLERMIGKACILGLGFGMGEEKLNNTLVKDNIRVSRKESTQYVDTYRTTYRRIPDLWHYLDYARPTIAHGRGTQPLGPCTIAKGCIILPNGMPITYPHLRQEKSGEWLYTFGNESRTLWGGKMAENVAQALARILVMDYAQVIRKDLELKLALQIHDELDYVVPERDAESLAAGIKQIMTVPPTWGKDLPVAVDILWGPTLGDCK